MLRSTVKSDKSKVGILTLDIQNAFNSAPWDAILKAIYKKDIPNYLQRIIRSFLENRLLIYESGGIEEEVVVTCGVPQGSVLGPTLWNILYDVLLCNRLPPGVEYLAFADDVALVAKARDSIRLEQLLSSSAQKDMSASRWMELAKIQRRMCLRVDSAYSTVSRDAVGVIAPIDLMVKDRKRVYQERKDHHLPPADEDTMAEWQGRWHDKNKDKWTYRLIPDIKRWINRRHGEVNFHLTQALSGHT
ncbi:hypothetical protein QTP88_020949 [Uroleucon formosanum]